MGVKDGGHGNYLLRVGCIGSTREGFDEVELCTRKKPSVLIGSASECASNLVRMHLLNWSALVIVLLVFGLVCQNFFVSLWFQVN